MARVSCLAAFLMILAGTSLLLRPLTPRSEGADEKPAASKLADAKSYQSVVKPFVQKYCISCHGPDKQKGKLRLDTLAADFASTETQGKWIEVMDRLNLGEMPPEKSPKPAIEQVQQVRSWIAGELRFVEKQALAGGGRVLMRRLNRTEYTNTIRDLLHVTFLPGDGPASLLPPDGKVEGFDKVSAGLTLDPSLLEKYFEVARLVADRAIVTGSPPFATLRKRFEFENTAKSGAIRYLCTQPSFVCREKDVVVYESGARSFAELYYGKTRRMIPTKGLYAVRVRASGNPGTRGEPILMRVFRGDEIIGDFKVGPEPKVYEAIVPLDEPGGNEMQVRLLNGTRFGTVQRQGLDLDQGIDKAGKQKDFATVGRLRGRVKLEAAGRGAIRPEVVDQSNLPSLTLDWIEVEGPLIGPWPPRSHTALLFKDKSTKKDLDYIRDILKKFLPRAFRRPVKPEEIEKLVRLANGEMKNGASFEDGLRMAIVGALTSPKFLYLIEPAAEQPRPLNDHELASRLSYFLWNSMPDDKLFELAAAGKLRDPQVMQAQVDRMLADPKSEAMVTGFAAQWLRTDKFLDFMPDQRIYKEFDDKLGDAMVGQTLAFFKEVFRRDLSTLSFLDSDWTMLNDRLAKFYGLPAVGSDEFRKVKLPAGSPRGGLLGQAGVALYGSDGTRTKPVHRAVYVREVLFNDPPDPPPPNVGEIEPNIKGKNLTVRERLLQHQQIPACASCHRTIDPYGLALENFNAIGAWRDKQDGEGFRPGKAPPIVVEGKLPGGQSFKTYAEFKKLLVDQKERFARGLAEKMLVYALGRPVRPGDRALVDRLAARMADEGYTFKSLIKGIVVAPQFTTK